MVCFALGVLLHNCGSDDVNEGVCYLFFGSDSYKVSIIVVTYFAFDMLLSAMCSLLNQDIVRHSFVSFTSPIYGSFRSMFQYHTVHCRNYSTFSTYSTFSWASLEIEKYDSNSKQPAPKPSSKTSNFSPTGQPYQLHYPPKRTQNQIIPIIIFQRKSRRRLNRRLCIHFTPRCRNRRRKQTRQCRKENQQSHAANHTLYAAPYQQQTIWL
jgi:hypothetical protein